MSGATVCVECFADDFMRDLVRREGAPVLDDEEACYFCGTFGGHRIPADELAERFENVVCRLFRSDQQMELREQEGSGETLGELFCNSLGTLNSDMDEPDDLLRAVLEERWINTLPDDDHPDIDASWILAEDDLTADSYTDALDTLRAEVLRLGHALHFGPGKRVAHDGPIAAHAYDLIRGALELTEIALDPGTILHRARLDLSEAGRSRPEEFLPPPVKLAKASRANLQGERVWYLARESETARAELRPGRASAVSVAEIVLQGQLRLCGLDRRLLETSPFEDLDKYEKEKAVADAANAMGQMFAKPIRPGDTDTEYLITQFLARMMREDGFDGIAYPSSQNPEGLNYVLFDPTLQCTFGPVRTYGCQRVTYHWDERPLIRSAGRSDEEPDAQDGSFDGHLDEHE